MVRTVNLKLIIPSQEYSVMLENVCRRYVDVCNYVSDWIFHNEFLLNFMKLQRKIYHIIRDKFAFNSQMVISALKTVTARYKTIEELFKARPFTYDDKDGSKKYISKTLEWLMKPVRFVRMQCDLVRNRNYRILSNGQITITTLQKTIAFDFVAPSIWYERIKKGWQLGTAKLLKKGKKWFVCVPMSINENKESQKISIKKIVGIDRGLNFIAATADNNNRSYFYRGRLIQKIRNKYAKTRQKLQKKNTRDSRRRILEIGRRENRWISDVNHCVSKTLVTRYGYETLFVLEDLTGITFDEKILSGTNIQRREKRSWSFYQLEQFLKYKAEEFRSLVINVSAKYTSQRCPKCGKIDKKQRHHNEHEYSCECGYRSNDDRIGALNLLELGKRYLQGERNPSFRKEAIQASPVSCGHGQLSEMKNLRYSDLKEDFMSRYNLAESESLSEITASPCL